MGGVIFVILGGCGGECKRHFCKMQKLVVHGMYGVKSIFKKMQKPFLQNAKVSFETGFNGFQK